MKKSVSLLFVFCLALAGCGGGGGGGGGAASAPNPRAAADAIAFAPTTTATVFQAGATSSVPHLVDNTYDVGLYSTGVTVGGRTLRGKFEGPVKKTAAGEPDLRELSDALNGLLVFDHSSGLRARSGVTSRLDPPIAASATYYTLAIDNIDYRTTVLVLDNNAAARAHFEPLQYQNQQNGAVAFQLTLGERFSNPPTGPQTYRGRSGVTHWTKGDARGDFTMRVNFDMDSIMSLSGTMESDTMGTATLMGTAISINTTAGTFQGAITLGGAFVGSGGATESGVIYGDFHGAGARGVSGIFESDAIWDFGTGSTPDQLRAAGLIYPEYGGFILGSRQ